jgi:hypothetical protein
MNILILVFCLLSIPIIFQFLIGNKALHKFIILPFWAVSLISVILLIIISIFIVYLTGTLMIIAFGFYGAIILVVLIIIQAFVFYINSDKIN